MIFFGVLGLASNFEAIDATLRDVCFLFGIHLTSPLVRVQAHLRVT